MYLLWLISIFEINSLLEFVGWSKINCKTFASWFVLLCAINHSVRKLLIENHFIFTCKYNWLLSKDEKCHKHLKYKPSVAISTFAAHFTFKILIFKISGIEEYFRSCESVFLLIAFLNYTCVNIFIRFRQGDTLLNIEELLTMFY